MTRQMTQSYSKPPFPKQISPCLVPLITPAAGRRPDAAFDRQRHPQKTSASSIRRRKWFRESRRRKGRRRCEKARREGGLRYALAF